MLQKTHSYPYFGNSKLKTTTKSNYDVSGSGGTIWESGELLHLADPATFLQRLLTPSSGSDPKVLSLCRPERQRTAAEAGRVPRVSNRDGFLKTAFWGCCYKLPFVKDTLPTHHRENRRLATECLQ